MQVVRDARDAKEVSMQLRYDLEKKMKEKLRHMWRKIFADPKAYEQFYFENMYPKNQVLTLKKDGTLAGMIHLNPYEVCVNEVERTLHYIVGVATLKEYRRQGIMRKMLVKCMQDMADQGEVFTYLMPAKKEYYEPFDFVFVQQFFIEKMRGISGKSHLKAMRPEEEIDVCKSLDGYFKERKSVYTKIDLSYLQQLKNECACEDGEILLWKEDGKIKGFCCYGKEEETVFVRQIFAEDEKGMQEEISHYFPEKKIELTLCHGEEKGATIMARVLRLDLLMPFVKGKSEVTCHIHIEDPIMEAQNGDFLLSISRKGCKIEPTDQKSDECISIRDFTKVLFGFEAEKIKEEHPKLKQIIPLSPVMIGEII